MKNFIIKQQKKKQQKTWKQKQKLTEPKKCKK